MLTAVRKCNMPKTPILDPKVVDLASFRQKVNEDQEVKMVDYVPSEQDVVAFLKVLRYLQKKTDAEQVELEANADGFTIGLTEFETVTDDSDTSIDYTTISHKTFVPFPFMLVDLDPCELTVHPSGQNTVELFSESLAGMMAGLKTR